MEYQYIWFKTPAGCGVGCLAVILTVATCIAAFVLGATTTVVVLVSAVPATILSALAFRVDRRRAGRR